jgi:hypothetical protein
MKISEFEISVPVLIIDSEVTHTTPRVPTAFEWTILHFFSRLSGQPDFNGSPIFEELSSLFEVPGIDEFWEDALENLLSLGVLTRSAYDIEYSEISLDHLRLTDRGMTMIEKGLLPGEPETEYIKHYYDPLNVRLSAKRNGFGSLNGVIKNFIPDQPFVDIYPEEKIREALPGEKHRWLTPKTQIEGVLKIDCEAAYRTVNIDVSLKQPGIIDLVSTDSGVKNFLNSRNPKELYRSYIMSIFESEYNIVAEEALNIMPFSQTADLNLFSIDSLVYNHLHVKPDVVFTDVNRFSATHYKGDKATIVCLGKGAYEGFYRSDDGTVEITIGIDYPFVPCSCLAGDRLFGAFKTDVKLYDEALRIPLAYSSEPDKKNIQHVKENAFRVILNEAKTNNVSFFAWLFLIHQNSKTVDLVSNYIVASEHLEEDLIKIKDELESLGLKDIFTPLVFKLFTHKCGKEYENNTVSGSSIGKLWKFTESLPVPPKDCRKLHGFHFDYLKDYKPDSVDDLKPFIHLASSCKKKIDPSTLDNFLRSLSVASNRQILEESMDLYNLLNSVESLPVYFKFSGRLVAELSKKEFNAEVLKTVFTLARKDSKQAKVFGEIAVENADVPDDFNDWFGIVNEITARRIQIPEKIFSAEIFNHLLRSNPISRNKSQIIQKDDTGKILLEFIDSSRQLLTLLELSDISEFQVINNLDKIETLEASLQTYLKLKKDLLSRIPRLAAVLKVQSKALENLKKDVAAEVRNRVKYEDYRSIFIVDTNLIIDEPVKTFDLKGDELVVVSKRVLEELDDLKLKKPHLKGNINRAISSISNNSRVTIAEANLKDLPAEYKKNKGDNQILALCQTLSEYKPILVSGDKVLLLKAQQEKNLKTLSSERYFARNQAKKTNNKNKKGKNESRSRFGV